jgi:hypothetical protein
MPAPEKPASTVSLRQVANLMAAIGRLDTAVSTNGSGSATGDPAYQSAVQSVGLGLFRLVVMGEIKKGKSSFINALVGIPGLVPVHSDVATSTVFKIRYGQEKRYTVYFQKESEDEEPKKLVITEAQLNDYGTENGNPNNVKKVAFIAVEAPSPVLNDGLILVDTPGVGGLFKAHRDITYKHAPKADAIFFITDSVECPIGADEVQFLNDLRRITSLIFFVQTKAAQVDTDACKKRMENNITILTTQAGFRKEDLRYFVIDSGLKSDFDQTLSADDLQDSGFGALRRFLMSDLKKRKNENLAAVGLKRAQAYLESAKAKVVNERAIFCADSAEKQENMMRGLREADAALCAWEKEVRGPLFERFQEEISSTSTLRTSLQMALKPGGYISTRISETLQARVKQKNLSAENVCDMLPQILQDMKAAASEELIQTLGELEKRIISAAESFAAAIGAKLQQHFQIGKPGAVFNDDPVSVNAALRPELAGAFEKMRTAVYGGFAGGAIAMVVGGTIGSVIPVVGTIIGGHLGLLIASWWGIGSAYSKQSKQELHSALVYVLTNVDKELGNMMTKSNEVFVQASDSIMRKALKAIEQVKAEVQQQLVDSRKKIQERAKLSAEELRAQDSALKKKETTVQGLSAQLVQQKAANGLA